MGALISPSFPAGKWMGFVTAVWVQSISGNKYTLSNYSAALKSLMGLTQLQFNNLSVAKDVGKGIGGLLAGIASDRLSTPVILLIGSVEGLVGYGVQWLVVSQKIQPLPYWQMCIFMCMGGNNTTWMNTAVLVTCMRNFRKSRGPVSGILKGYAGLSTAIFTDLCSALFSDSPSSFLLMLSIVPFLVCLAAMLFLREAYPAAADDKDEGLYFCFFNTVAVVIAVYLLVFDVSGEHGRAVSRAFKAVLLGLMAVPVGVPIYAGWKAKRVTDLKPDPERESLLRKGKEKEEEEEEEEEHTILEAEEEEEEHTILEAFSIVDFWILIVSFLCGVGTGLAVMNNIGQMGLALGFVDVKMIVSLTRIFGVFRRIGSGCISEYYIKNEKWINTPRPIQQSRSARASEDDDVEEEVDEEGAVGVVNGDEETPQGSVCVWDLVRTVAKMLFPTGEERKKKSRIPRPLWNALSQILMAVGYVIMAMALPGSLSIGSIIAGLCYGVRLAVTVTMASERFGLKCYGLIYNILILNLTLGSFLFSHLLAGFLYDAQATRTHGGGYTCVGAHCYRLFFVIMALVCIVGFGLDLVLVFRTKSLIVFENPNE